MHKLVTAAAAGIAAVLTTVGLSCVGLAPAGAAPAGAAPAAHPLAQAIARPAAAAKVPVVYSQPNWMGPQVKPAHFYDITGDSSEWLNTPHWKHWNDTSAYSVGQYAYRSCFGSCDKFKTVRAKITLWRVRAHGNTLYYTRLKWVYVLKHHRHVVVAWFNPPGPLLWVRH